MGLELVILLLGILSAGSAVTSANYWLGTHRRRASRALDSIRQAQRLSSASEAVIANTDRELRKASQEHVQAKLRQALANEPVQALKAYSKGIRFQALADAGIESLLDLKKIPTNSLMKLRGIGPVSAQAIAEGLEAALQDIGKNRINFFPELPLSEPSSVKLLRATHNSIESRRLMEPHLRGLQSELDRRATDSAKAGFAAKPWGWLTEFSKKSKIETFDALARLEVGRDDLRQQCAWAEEAASGYERKVNQSNSTASLEGHYTVNAAHYSAYLAAVLPTNARAPREPHLPSTPTGHRRADGKPIPFLGEESSFPARGLQSDRPQRENAGFRGKRPQQAPIRSDLRYAHGTDASGGLPREIARVVESFRLNGSRMAPGVMLRAYQAFGAKYLLQQKRTILGDEMGLGKTIQALSMIAHLHAIGRRHAVVLAPAGTIQNWARETANFTDLPCFTPRAADIPISQWHNSGGILICSFNGFGIAGGSDYISRCDVVVVDEAHYIKNPGTIRSMEAAVIIKMAEYVVLMSGTPMENRVDEFIELVSHTQAAIGGLLRERLSQRDGNLGALVAPTYLRRNQEDVLHELPERIEIEEWVDFSEPENVAYKAFIREAQMTRNMMLARRTSSMPLGAESSKIGRIAELLAQYETTGEKVVIFSFFLDCLNDLASRFTCVGRIDGSMSSGKRLAMIEALQNHRGHAVLLCQIEAGGIGLNIQAASVAIILEPQFKPSTENQAIARLHRMGQLRRVVVHRMLARNRVEISMRNRVIDKQRDFDRKVRDSDIKDQSVDATNAAFLNSLIEEENLVS